MVLEERRAELLLESLDLPADRTGRDAELLGGPHEAPVAGRRLEGEQGRGGGNAAHGSIHILARAVRISLTTARCPVKAGLAADSIDLTTTVAKLNWRACHGAVGAENTAITMHGLEQSFAGNALMIVDARVSRHDE